MALQNFVDHVGPVVGAAWLNQVDVFLNTALFLAVKQSPTSRTSTTQLNDQDLAISIPAGSYDVEVLMYPWASVTTAQGISWNINFSGTFSSSGSSITLISSNPTTIGGISVLAGAQATGVFGIGSGIGLTPFGLSILNKGTLLAASTSGILGLSWAPGGSTGNPTTVGQGSYMKLTKLA